MDIKDLVREAYEISDSKGFHKVAATFGDRIALCHTELSEAMEAFRENDNDSFNAMEPIYRSKQTGFLTRSRLEYRVLPNELGEPQETLVLNKPEGVPAELADVVIRIADMCGVYGIDLDKAIQQKLEYNKTRPYMHGNKKL